MAGLTQFDLVSARRIAEVVRRVEGEPPRAKPLVFERVWNDGRGGSNPIRICKFTGSWLTNASKIVTLKHQTATPNTFVASNLFANISVDCGERNCAIARSGTAWFLIAAQC